MTRTAMTPEETREIITGGNDGLTIEEFNEKGEKTDTELCEEVQNYEVFLWRDEKGQRFRHALSSQISVQSEDGWELRLVGKTYPGHNKPVVFSHPKPYAVSETRKRPRAGSEGMRSFSLADFARSFKNGRDAGRGETPIETALWGFIEEWGVTWRELDVVPEYRAGSSTFPHDLLYKQERPWNFKGVLTPDTRRGFPGPERQDIHDSSVYYKFRSIVDYQGFRLWTPARVREQFKNGRTLTDSSGVLDHTEWFRVENGAAHV